MKKICRRGTILLMCIMLLSVQAAAVEQLIPVGKVIGIELFDGSVTVAAIDETLGGSARAAGLQVGDKILRVDQKEITCARDVRYALDRSDVQVELTVERKGKVETLQLQPQVTPDGPRLGIYLRQGITGVGTVTWYDPDTGAFGALGHGVNTQSGDLLPMEKGNIYAATVAGVNKGEPGKPGQLLGALEGETPVGTLTENTAQGIFGKALRDWEGQAIPVGEEQDVQTGQAQILSTVSDGQTQTYCVEILKVYPNAGNTGRNMLLRVTDPALLSTTGGIVQGMSGSPIIQDGKLIGAVTHVLVNDPTTGYGIFIENMLDAAA